MPITKRQQKFTLSLSHKILMSASAFLVKIWLSTLRMSCSKEQAEILKKNKTASFFIWHNKILFTIPLKKKFRKLLPMCGLVSPSKDGDYLTAFFDKFGIETVRGSSSRNGSSAIIAMIDKLENDISMCVTPDGPRGPKYKFKGASVDVAEKAGCPMVFMRVYPKRYKVVKTWDGFVLPLPFTKVNVQAFGFESCEEFKAVAKKNNMKENELIEFLLGGDLLEENFNKLCV